MGHRCGICKRTFSTSSGLTQHANAVHHGRISLSRTNELIQGSQDQNMMQTYGVHQLQCH